MTVHHATRTAAAKLAIELTELDTGLVQAECTAGETESVFAHADAKVARSLIELQRKLEAGWTGMEVELSDTTSPLIAIVHVDDDEPLAEGDLSIKGAVDLLFADALDEAGRRELAIEAEEEEPQSGSVVADHYKRLYAEQGHAGDCGDDLAAYARAMDLTAFEGFCNENGVFASAKLDATRDMGTPGWQGRRRMTLGNMLRKVAKANEWELTHYGKRVNWEEAREAEAARREEEAKEKAAAKAERAAKKERKAAAKKADADKKAEALAASLTS